MFSRIKKTFNCFLRNTKTLFDKCLYRYINPNTTKYWDNKLSKYDAFWRNENYYHILDLFPKNESFSVFDLGCAIGDGCELLKENFPKAKIVGADISRIGIIKATNKSKVIQYIVYDVLRKPIPSVYDYITIIETLEHFDDPFFIVDKCLKHVKKSLIISTPYTQGFTGKKVEGNEHRYQFNEKTFVNYDARVVKITDFVKVTANKCIIYEIRPKSAI